MSNTLNTVLERLRAFGNDKLAELDSRAEAHRGWLRTAVEEVAQQIAALAPASKKQRLNGRGAAKVTAAEEQVCAPPPPGLSLPVSCACCAQTLSVDPLVVPLTMFHGFLLSLLAAG